MSTFSVAIVGNPNSGKSTLFNRLTQSNQPVGNWSGVTVNDYSCCYRYNNVDIKVIDLPGVYYLAHNQKDALDEQVTNQYLQNKSVDLIINLIDPRCLERSLYLTIQLIDIGIPIVLVINDIDNNIKCNQWLNLKSLSQKMDAQVVTVLGKDKKLIELKDIIHQLCQKPKISIPIELDFSLEKAVASIKNVLNHQNISRWEIFQLLESDFTELSDKKYFYVTDQLQESVKSIRQKLEQEKGVELDIILANSRYEKVNEVNNSVKKHCEDHSSNSHKIDNILLDKWLGLPIFFVVMYVMFTFSINAGGVFIDFFDQFFGSMVLLLEQQLESLSSPDWLVVLLAHGVGGGIQTVATFIPSIFFLFVSLAFLEHVGYMARVTFLMDRFMRFFGLPGKAFVPLLVGFGCNVPAITATRMLDSYQSRLVTMALIPFMSCGARLSVYVVFSTAFFSKAMASNVVFFLYMTGFALALLTAFLMKILIFKDSNSSYFMELTHYRMPSLLKMSSYAFKQTKAFVKNSGKMIIIVVIFLSFLTLLDQNGDRQLKGSESTILSQSGKVLLPVFKLIGVGEDNWPAVVAIFTGLLAKETILGTLDVLYEQSHSKNSRFDPWIGIKNALATIPENFFTLFGFYSMDNDENKSVAKSTIVNLQNAFGSQKSALAYLLFILLYTPCIATLAVICKESNAKWTIAIALWSFVLAYFVSFAYYRLETSSLIILVVSILGLMMGLSILKKNKSFIFSE